MASIVKEITIDVPVFAVDERRRDSGSGRRRVL